MKKHVMSFLAAVFLLPVFFGCMPHTTGETEIGVRTRKIAIFGDKGVEDKAYPPGSTYFFLPFVNDWDTFDAKLQNVEMTLEQGKGDRASRDDLPFKTIDGNDVGLDVIIVYRIDPAKAPYIRQHVAPNDRTLRQKIFRAVARSKPRDIFGELTTEEFYVAEKRDQQAEKARAALHEILDPMGIIVERVLTKDYRFNPEYQKAIEDKKIADQEVGKNRSAQHAAFEDYKKKVEDAQGEVNKAMAEVDGQFRKAKIEVDAYYDQQANIAKAIRAEGIAEAKAIDEMNKALSGSGGEAIVKLRLAEALQGKKIFLLPVGGEGGMNLKTTNVNELLNVMGLQKVAQDGK